MLALLSVVASASSGCGNGSNDTVSDGGAFDVILEPKDGAVNPDGSLRDTTADREKDDALPDGSLPDATPPDGTVPDATHPDITHPDIAHPDIAPPDVMLPDVTPDVASPDGDGSTCPGDIVWNGDSATLRLTISGGSILLPPPTACVGPTIYEFSPGAQTLSQTGCANWESVHHVVHLASAETSRLTTEIEALRTTCRTTCWADVPSMTLTLSDASSCVRHVYESNYESGCGNLVSLPPYIDFERVNRLESLFRGVVTTACETDGGVADLGTCDTGDGGAVRVCRTSPQSVDVITDAPTEAAPDADLDAATDSDGSVCPTVAVWSDASTSFSLTSTGGLPWPADSGCPSTNVTYWFSKQTKTLVKSGCSGGGPGGRTQLELPDDRVDEIVTAMAALRSTCEKICGVDAPAQSITIGDCGGWTEGTFNSNFYAACDWRPAAPPYIEFMDLWSLVQRLESMLASSCDGADAGSPGTCQPYCRQRLR